MTYMSQCHISIVYVSILQYIFFCTNSIMCKYIDSRSITIVMLKIFLVLLTKYVSNEIDYKFPQFNSKKFQIYQFCQYMYKKQFKYFFTNYGEAENTGSHEPLFVGCFVNDVVFTPRKARSGRAICLQFSTVQKAFTYLYLLGNVFMHFKNALHLWRF